MLYKVRTLTSVQTIALPANVPCMVQVPIGTNTMSRAEIRAFQALVDYLDQLPRDYHIAISLKGQFRTYAPGRILFGGFMPALGFCWAELAPADQQVVYLIEKEKQDASLS